MRQMLDYARKARTIAEGRSRQDLDSDDMLQLALTRAIEVIGEAASRISEPTRELYHAIPWRNIVSMRNRLIHGYDTVDLELLWDTVTHDVPPLIEQLEAIIVSGSLRPSP
jgi:uncharacterized protein with HEPN domain